MLFKMKRYWKNTGKHGKLNVYIGKRKHHSEKMNLAGLYTT